MAKYRGRVDCYLEPGSNRQANGEFFVNLVQHISSSMPDLGIEMLAWNYGTDGSGWDFWDEANPVSYNAFAVFRFHSASQGSFDCFIYENTGSVYTGSVYIDQVNDGTSDLQCYKHVGISFACHPSGSVPNTMQNSTGPWDGGYGAGAWVQTSTELWKTSSSGKGAFFPRPNGLYGESSGSRAALLGIGGDGMNQSRAHFIVSEDSLTILSDDSLDTETRIMHFGPYMPRSGVLCDSPYIMWTNLVSGIPWPGRYDATIGSRTRVDGAATVQGAMAHPNLHSGAFGFSFGYLAHDVNNGYNNFINSGSYEKFPVWTIINESIGGKINRGILGTLKHITSGIGMPNLSVSTLSSSAAIGTVSTSDLKVIVPWDGDPPETTVQVRTGRNFSIG